MPAVNWSGQGGGSSGGAVAFDPTTTFSLFEDFSTGFEGAGSGQITSDNSWATAQTGSPTITTLGTSVKSDTNHPGVLEIGTASGTSTGAAITTGIFNGSLNNLLTLGGGQITYEVLANIPVLSNGTDDATLSIGLRTNPAYQAIANGLELFYTRSGSVNWQGRCTASSVTTTTASSIPVTTGWHHLKIVVDATAANVLFYVDNVLAVTISTNIPTVFLPVMITWVKVAGTTTMYAGIDYIKIDKTFTSAR